MADGDNPALARLLRDPDVAAAMLVLSERVAGADLTTLLLEVARRRSSRLTPAQVLEQPTTPRLQELLRQVLEH